MITRADITPIGKFHKTHALKGELNAVLDIDAEFLDRTHPLIVDVDGIYVPFYCESVRPKGHFSSLVKLQDIDTEDDAKEFVNKEIFALKSDITEFDNEFERESENEGTYADDLVGYKIVDVNTGHEIGEISGLNLSTANALFIIQSGEDTIMIPIADEFIKNIDDEAHVIEMQLPEGLVDINT
ncbi:MAG: ribosome maturation factor RimM [Prevotella sp.]|nr:ribosome maturation factor RimM [Bacteroides sp.]MCM1365649.1 ribosome maturation factor RimM [Prevotella sp.]